MTPLVPPLANPAHASHDIEDLRVAFGAVCDADFSASSLSAMTAEATRQLRQRETDVARDDTGGAALQVAMLRELLAMAHGRDLTQALH